MKNIPLRYEGVSGQGINFHKSNIMFSPNTIETNKRLVCENLELGEVHVSGKYLGMSMHVGKNNNSVFGFLTERIGQKLQWWKHQSLSKAGKFTLLKTSTHVIPNFWMSLFLLPNEVCNAIENR